MAGNDSEQIGKRFKTITSDLKLYMEKRVELLLLNAGEQLSRVASESIQKLIGILLALCGAVFLLVALSIYLGEVLGNPSMGYLIVSIPLLLTGLIFLYLKPTGIQKKLQRHFESELVNVLTPPSRNERKSPNLPESVEESQNQE